MKEAEAREERVVNRKQSTGPRRSAAWCMYCAGWVAMMVASAGNRGGLNRGR